MTTNNQTASGAVPAQAPFALNIVWHPDNSEGADIANALRRHFGTDRYRNIVGGNGITVLYRSARARGTGTPLPVDWNSGEAVATVALIDRLLAGDADWLRYLHGLAAGAERRGMATRLFPVALVDEAVETGLEVQALRWDQWPEHDGGTERLVRELAYRFSRMVRHCLDQRSGEEGGFRRYREPVHVFLSHSKHDGDGETVARAIRDWLHEHGPLPPFLDIYDMEPGVRVDTAIEETVGDSVLIAIYTDSYSSREWCRREALAAKRHGIPMLVVDCLKNGDDRAFPYLWNVSVVRMEPSRLDRIGQAVSLLLDEVFRHFLWRQRTSNHSQLSPRTVFTSRPPELTTAAMLPADHQTGGCSIIYPDPPFGAEEQQLFADVLPSVRVATFSEWFLGSKP